MQQLHEMPDLVLQNIVSGRTANFKEGFSDNLLEIQGISHVTERVWGYYLFDYNNTIITVIGIDPYEKQYSTLLDKIYSDKRYDNFKKSNSAILGYGLYEMFKGIGYIEKLYLSDHSGAMVELPILGYLHDTDLKYNDVIFVHKETAKNLLGIPENEFTDLAITIPNKNEIDIIAAKIKEKYKNLNIINKNDILIAYSQYFNLMKGFALIGTIFLILMIVIIVSDRIIGYGYEKKEITILKAVGWSIEQIVSLKLLESFFIATLSYFFAVSLSYIYIFFLDAPILKDHLLGISKLRIYTKIPANMNFSSLFITFLITTVPFVLASIIPAWKVSSKDVMEDKL
ncbi:MAG: FtsX-like permease family protein [Deferribacterales bacterium]